MPFMRTVTCKSGLKGWRCHLRENYASFGEFSKYSEIQGLHDRLGYESPREAWDANPLVEGSVNPTDYRVVPLKEIKMKTPKAKKIKVLSQKAYRESGGSMCPMCKSHNMDTGRLEVDGDVTTQNIVCVTCGSEWTDVWTLKSFDNLNEGMSLAQHQEIYAKACEVEEINLKQ